VTLWKRIETRDRCKKCLAARSVLTYKLFVFVFFIYFAIIQWTEYLRQHRERERKILCGQEQLESMQMWLSNFNLHYNSLLARAIQDLHSFSSFISVWSMCKKHQFFRRSKEFNFCWRRSFFMFCVACGWRLHIAQFLQSFGGGFCIVLTGNRLIDQINSFSLTKLSREEKSQKRNGPFFFKQWRQWEGLSETNVESACRNCLIDAVDL